MTKCTSTLDTEVQQVHIQQPSFPDGRQTDRPTHYFCMCCDIANDGSASPSWSNTTTCMSIMLTTAGSAVNLLRPPRLGRNKFTTCHNSARRRHFPSSADRDNRASTSSATVVTFINPRYIRQHPRRALPVWLCRVQVLAAFSRHCHCNG